MALRGCIFVFNAADIYVVGHKKESFKSKSSIPRIKQR